MSTTSILQKVSQERSKGELAKALRRLNDAIRKIPGDIDLYTEALDIALEAGETRAAVKYLRQALLRFPSEEYELWHRAEENIQRYNDPVLAKFLMDQAIRQNQLDLAFSVVEKLKDHTAEELLQRIHTKMETLDVATDGGDSFKGEVAINAIGEVVLHMRVKRYLEGALALLTILDDKRVEPETFVALLSFLKSRFPKKGPIVYATGCCALAAGDFVTGMHRMLNGLALTPSLADDAIARLRPLEMISTVPRDELQLAFVKIFLAKGDHNAASDCIDVLIRKTPDKSRALLDILEPSVGDVGHQINLQLGYLDAALLAREYGRAHKLISRIYETRRHRETLLSWLDAKLEERTLSPDLMMYYGEIALEQRMFDKASDILRHVLAQSPQDAALVQNLLAPYRADRRINDLFTLIHGSLQAGQPSAMDFQVFDNQEFSLNDHGAPAGEGEIVPDVPPLSAEPPREPPVASYPEPTVESLPEGFETYDSPWARTPATETPSAPGTTSWATQDPTETTDPPESPPAWEPSAPTTVDLPADPQAELEPAPPKDFDTRLAEFRAGAESGDSALGLIDDALRLGRLADAQALFDFMPSTVGEEIQRKLYIADYYMLTDAPLSALITLRSIRLQSLGRDECRNYLLKIGRCYHELNMFEAACSMYQRIIADDPNDGVAVQLTRRSYGCYLRLAMSGAALLEKTTAI